MPTANISSSVSITPAPPLSSGGGDQLAKVNLVPSCTLKLLGGLSYLLWFPLASLRLIVQLVEFLI